MTNKPRRGRPKGATSFIKVPLRDLVDYLGGDANVVASKKWILDIGMHVEESQKNVLTPINDEPKIQFNVYE